MMYIIGDYTSSLENNDKIYVQEKNGLEIASFCSDSMIINKRTSDNVEKYSNIDISAPVQEFEDRLYVNAEGFMKGFNSTLAYNKAENTIIIQTLPYLVNYYTENIKNYGYDKLSEDFENQKALIYGVIVASKESTGNYGVIDRKTGEEVIAPRYSDIKFLESQTEFVITTRSEKVGISYGTGRSKIDTIYDEIKVLDRDLGYYLVKSNGKYGVIDSEGKIVIHIDYDKIGINTEDFKGNMIENKYMLYNTLIPVSLNGKWGFFNKNGKKITDLEYDTVGCINNDITDKTVNDVALIGDTEVIVVSKDERYGGIGLDGTVLMMFMFTNVYSVNSEGETMYGVVFEDNGLEYNAVEYIEAMKERVGYTNKLS